MGHLAPGVGIGAKRTRHVPSAPVVVATVWPAMDTVTASPGSAVPQTGTGMPCCSTAWSEKSGLGETVAWA